MDIDKHKGLKQGAEGTKIKILRHPLFFWDCGGNESYETLRSGAHTGCLEQKSQEAHAIVPDKWSPWVNQRYLIPAAKTTVPLLSSPSENSWGLCVQQS